MIGHLNIFCGMARWQLPEYFLWPINLAWAVGWKIDGGIIFLNLQPVTSHRTQWVRHAAHPAIVRRLAFSLTCGTECEQTDDGHTPRVYLPAEEGERRAEHGLPEICW